MCIMCMLANMENERRKSSSQLMNETALILEEQQGWIFHLDHRRRIASPTDP